jgi:predicted HAD superfamily phosphohydrolase YqeG
MGFHVVVVDAINRTNEKWFTRLNRIMEKRVLRQIQRRNPRLFEQLHLNEKR